MQPVTISVALDCVTWDEIIIRHYDGLLLGRLELPIVMGQSRIRHWFWDLMSWEFFLAERTFYQVMPVYGVPRDPPPYGLSFKTIVLGDLTDATGSFDAYMDTSRDYTTLFAVFFAGPIIGNALVSGGRVLGGIICA